MEPSNKSNQTSTFSIVAVRTFAFIIFCGISVVLNLNMLILLASTFIEKVVFILISIGIEGAKIYYIVSAPIYKKMGKVVRAKLYYVLYITCAFISITAAYGFITTTVASTDALSSLQSNKKSIVYIDKDLELIDNQINDLLSKQTKTREMFDKDVSIIDSQIDTLVSALEKPTPKFIITEDMEEKEITTIKTQERDWKRDIDAKKKELETLKKQKTSVNEKHTISDEKITSQINTLRGERNSLIAEQSGLENKEAEVLIEGKGGKTDMFTAIGSSFGLSGRYIMTILLLFIAFTIEFGIVATVPDPNLIIEFKADKQAEKEVKSEDLPKAKEEIKIEPFPEKIIRIEDVPIEATPLPVVKIQTVVPVEAKSEEIISVGIAPVAEKEVLLSPLPVRKTKKTSPPPDIFKPLPPNGKKREDVEPQETITTNITQPAIHKIKIEDEVLVKENIASFLMWLYNKEESPENLLNIDEAISRSGIIDTIAKRFFDRIVNLQGNRGAPLFTFALDTKKWRANYPLSYLLQEIVPKVRINFHEEKKQIV